MVDEEIERLKEKVKTNFFQIEKLFAEYDERLNNVEKKSKEIKRIGEIDKLKEELNKIKLGLKQIDEEIENKTEKLERNVIENRNFEEKIKQKVENTKQNFLERTKRVEELYKENTNKIENKQVELEKKLTEETRKKIDEYDKKINNLLLKKEKQFKEIEGYVGKRIEKAEYLGSRLLEIENLIKEFDKKSENWKVFSEDLERDKNLYLELREVVLASVEKLKNLEKLFSRNLEEFGEINDRVEEDEKLFKTLSAETNKELQRLDSEGRRIEKNVEEFKNKLKERLIKKFADMDFKLENDIKNKIKEQDALLSNYGGIFTKLEEDMKSIEDEVIPKKIDMEFNEMLLVLNNKLKDLVNKQDFDMLKAGLESKVEQIRKPEIKPLEERISAMEEDVNELKKLLRGIAQRLPVIVE